MNFGLAFVILFVAIIHCNYSVADQDQTRCKRGCTRHSDPVCGTLIRPDGTVISCTFGNPCLLKVHRCLTKEKWAEMRGGCLNDSEECGRITKRN